MAAGTAAAKISEPASAAGINLTEPEVLEFEPRHVQIDHAGHVSRSIIARSPKGLLADDLRSPAVWRRVQSSQYSALVQLDRLLILAHDQSWAAEAIVKYADHKSASLAILKVFSFAAVGETLFSDGTLEVYFEAGAYGVRRVLDKVPVASGFVSEGLAVDALRKQYPRKVG